MSANQNREYLEARVQTASSAQLHLMLIDGALRYGREAEKAVLRQDELAAQPLLIRTLNIVEELLVGVKDQQTDLNAKLAQLYTFVYTRLTSVYVNLDKQLMAEALRVLEFQQETWRQACLKLSTEARDEAPQEKAAAPKPHLGGVSSPSERFTLDA